LSVDSVAVAEVRFRETRTARYGCDALGAVRVRAFTAAFAAIRKDPIPERTLEHLTFVGLATTEEDEPLACGTCWKRVNGA
jgi:hypothetical protein